MFFTILITIIYLWIIYYFSNQTQIAMEKIKERNNNCLDENVILKGYFSTKAFNYFITALFISLILLSIIWLYSIMGSDNVSSVFNIEQSLCTFIYDTLWFGFLFTAAISIIYTWLNTGALGQFLIVTKESVIGTSCVINGLKIINIDFKIKITDIKNITLKNSEKVLGINLSTFNIVTNTAKYEYIFILDGYEIRRTIEENRC